jgi:DNA-binding NarL/FixJ family response regulator
MRVLLVGTPRNRARLRVDLEGRGVTIAGEFPTLAAARAADLKADAIVLAREAEGGILFDDDVEPGPPEPLTSREREVLELLAEGLPNKAMAIRLGISDQTIKFHVASICGKLGAMNRTDAVRRGVRLGLVTL